VDATGGELFETESERLICIGREEGMAQEIIESGQEFGLDDTAVIKRLQKKLSFTVSQFPIHLIFITENPRPAWSGLPKSRYSGAAGP
jgi:hypothetical protein